MRLAIADRVLQVHLLQVNHTSRVITFSYLTMSRVDQHGLNNVMETIWIYETHVQLFNDETSINRNNPAIPGEQLGFNFLSLLLYLLFYYFKITFASPRNYFKSSKIRSSSRKFHRGNLANTAHTRVNCRVVSLLYLDRSFPPWSTRNFPDWH